MKTAIIYIHGIQSHSGWAEETKEWFEKEGFYFYAPDRRGSGLSLDKRGHIDSWRTWITDLKDSVKFIQDTVKPEKIFLMGLCWGAKLVLAYQICHPGNIEGLILLTPGLKTKVSIKNKLGLIYSWITKNEKYFELLLKDEMFTEDPKYLSFIKNDPYKLTKVTSKFLMESVKIDRLISKNSKQIKIPVISFLAGRDPIVDNRATNTMLSKLHSKIGYYPGILHSIEYSKYKKIMLNTIKDWI